MCQNACGTNHKVSGTSPDDANSLQTQCSGNDAPNQTSPITMSTLVICLPTTHGTRPGSAQCSLNTTARGWTRLQRAIQNSRATTFSPVGSLQASRAVTIALLATPDASRPKAAGARRNWWPAFHTSISMSVRCTAENRQNLSRHQLADHAPIENRFRLGTHLVGSIRQELPIASLLASSGFIEHEESPVVTLIGTRFVPPKINTFRQLVGRW